MSRGANRGTSAVLLADLLATLGAVAFAIAYSKYNPWAFAPILVVTLFLSLLIAALVSHSDRTLAKGRSPSPPQVQSWYFFSPARMATVSQFSLGGSGQA